jgi:pantothenate kinase
VVESAKPQQRTQKNKLQQQPTLITAAGPAADKKSAKKDLPAHVEAQS